MAGRPRPPPVAVAPVYDLVACSLKSPSIFPSDYIEWSVEPSTRGRNLQHEEEDQEDDENDEKEASTRTAQVKDKGEAEPLPQRRPSVLGSESLAGVFEVAPRGGERAGLVRCLLVRNRRLGPLGATEYRLYLQGAKAPGGLNSQLEGDRLLLVATAQAAGAFHIFNLARGGVSGALTRKSGNFVGEFVRVSTPARSPVGALGLLRAAAFVLRSNVAHAELAAAAFHKPSLRRHVHDGPRPRHLNILVPGLDARRRPAVATANDDLCNGGGGVPLLEQLHDRVASSVDANSPWAGFRPATSKEAAVSESSGPRLLEVLAPAFDGTAYRLDFDGRATVPSVKNMQLVEPSDRSDVVLQLGKVSANEFHLDFKGPFNALQALAVALAQFSY